MSHLLYANRALCQSNVRVYMEVLGEEGLAALEDEVAERRRRRRERLCQVVDHMPTAHDRKSFGLRSGDQPMTEFEPQGVQRQQGDAHVLLAKLIDQAG